MRLLVAGGTGFIGSHVVRTLARRGGHEIVVMTRDPARARTMAGVSLVRGDVTDPSSLPNAVAGVDAIVHTVQFPNHPVENPRRGWTYERVDGEGTERMVAAARQAGVKRFVYLSGAGTRPGRSEPWIRAKVRAERAVMAGGMDYVIVRPSWLYGPGDRSMSKLVWFVNHLPVVPVIGSGRERIQPAFVEDLAAVVAAAVDHGPATNQVFEAGCREPLTMNDVLRTVMRVLGKQRALLHVPTGLVKALASVAGFMPGAPLSPAAVDFVTQDGTVEPAQMERVFGIRFRSLEEGLRAYLVA